MAIQLKAARVNADMTQEEAAKALGISKSTIINYEAYKTSPSVEMAKEMAKLYKMKMEDIIFFAD